MNRLRLQLERGLFAAAVLMLACVAVFFVAVFFVGAESSASERPMQAHSAAGRTAVSTGDTSVPPVPIPFKPDQLPEEQPATF
jgi:hypothetical protein